MTGGPSLPGDGLAALAQFLEAAPDAMLVADARGQILAVNQMLERTLGYPAAELIGGPVERLIPEAVRARHHEHLAAYVASPVARPMGAMLELVARHRDGHTIPIEIRLAPLDSARGPVILATLRDVTERRRAFEALRRSEHRLHDAMAMARMGAWELDALTGTRNASPELLPLFGIDRADRDPDGFLAAVHPDDRAEIARATRRAIEDGTPFQCELRARGGDGRWRRIATMATAVRDDDGRVVAVRGVARDVTEERRARDELMASRAQLGAVLGAVPDYVLLLDREGRIQFVNRVPPGVGVTDPVGHSWREHAPPDYRDEIAAAIEAVVERRESRWLTTTVTTGDGGLHHFSCQLAPVVHDGAVDGVVVLVRDVTERRRQQAQLAAADQMATLGMIAAGVAHEINNPLAAVTSNLDLAMSGAPGAAAALADARLAVERIRAIVRDLRVFSRVEREAPRPVDLAGAVEAAIRLAWNELRHHAQLVRHIATTPPVLGVESQLSQVALNLLVNAAHALPAEPRAGDTITVTTGVADDGRVFFEVADTGVGMTPEVRAQLFNPFFTTKPPGVGTGLGLAICHRIVTEHGGEIVVDSELGRGTRFRVLLPATTAAAATPEAGATPVTSTRRARILVVDDEVVLLSLMSRALADHEVVTAGGVAEALERIAPDPAFDLVLCDLMMPGQSGIDLYRAVEERWPALAPRIAFVSGGAFTRRAREFVDQSGVPVLDKPFSLGELLAFVARRLS